MRKSFSRVRGLGFFLWHGRHELYHVLLGLIWAWFLRERWNELNPRYITWAVVGSLLPDIDHIFYFFTYGKTDAYARTVQRFLKAREWRSLWVFLESGHKQQTNLASHNIYIMGFLFFVSLLSSFIEWRLGLILFGAMAIHYVFDILDDFLQLGTVNPNWKRWGRNKRTKSSLA